MNAQRTNIYRIASFIWRNYPPVRDWGAGLLVNWLAWNLNNQFLALVCDSEENIKGVGVARTVMKPEDGAHNGVLTDIYDPEGSVLFVDLAVCTHPVALKILVIKIRDRFGIRDTIAYLRHPDPQIRTRPLGAFRNAILRKELA